MLIPLSSGICELSWLFGPLAPPVFLEPQGPVPAGARACRGPSVKGLNPKIQHYIVSGAAGLRETPQEVTVDGKKMASEEPFATANRMVRPCFQVLWLQRPVAWSDFRTS